MPELSCGAVTVYGVGPLLRLRPRQPSNPERAGMALLLGPTPPHHLSSAFCLTKIQMMGTTQRLTRSVWGLLATLYLTLDGLPSRPKSAEERFIALSTRMTRERKTISKSADHEWCDMVRGCL